MKINEQILFLKAFTWSRDSHGLFDYESENIRKDRIPIQGSTLLSRKENSILSIPLSSSLPFQPLISVTKTALGYLLKPESTSEMWTVVDCIKGNSNSKGQELKLLDTIKFGRVKYKVKEICCTEQDRVLKTKGHVHPAKIQEDSICRICLIGEETNEPLISPCNCGGSMKFIHLSCFKKWVESKTTKRSCDGSLTYFVKSLTCEISKCPVQPMLRVNGQEVDLLNIQPVPVPYIVLESCGSDSKDYSLHQISLAAKDTVKLGRGHDSDIRISDISVSRCHAVVKYTEDGVFTLEDNSSKFGTLIENKEIDISKTNPFACIQVGRTLLVFKLISQDFNNCDISFDETDEEPE